MEDSQGVQNCSKFGDFVDKTYGASSRSAADIELHNTCGTSEAMYHRAAGFCRSDVLLDEESFASAFDTSLSLRNHPVDNLNNACNVTTDGIYPSGPMRPTSFQSCDPLLVQDESTCLQFETGSGDHQERAQYLGNLPLSYGMNDMGEQSQMYAHYQQVASNFMLQHDMDVRNHSSLQPSYVYPQLYATGSNVRSNQQSAVCRSARGRSTYGHQVVLDGSALQNRNNHWNSMFMDSYPFVSSDYHRTLEAEKFAHPYGLNSSSRGLLQSQFDDLSTMKLLMKSAAGINPVRTIKYSPPLNGYSYSGMGRRINGYGEALHLNGLNSRFISFESDHDLALKTAQLNFSSVDEVAGRIYMFAKDQNGCRFLQKVFTEGTKEDVEKIISEIIDHITELMMDQFGNYMVQKLLEECSDDQRKHIICEITRVPGDLITVACNMHGTRAVQKLIDTINTPEQISKVVSALSPGAMRLMTDANGSHVAQHCLKKLLPEYKAFLLDAATPRCVRLAKDQHGCCIIQKCIEHSNDDQKYFLLRNITSNALNLSEDQYGNYVIQFVVNLGVEWATSEIVNELEGNFGFLSTQKCGSHVVENCLRQVPQHDQKRIIHELMVDPKLPQIMSDPYGNFVIQTALKECKGDLHSAFVEAIRPHAPALQNNMYAKRVLSKTCLKNKQYRHFFL
ncbi:pumilio homolog 12-like [Oryza brachyantha]|uniref:PUM-HD domain-containing protein n=1 Tax=Oryza brachyantha TaxID=4533 RepID=J3N966_ORYBR|nr:pumilio homolog 12-like [Oryza brachyantha]